MRHFVSVISLVEYNESPDLYKTIFSLDYLDTF